MPILLRLAARDLRGGLAGFGIFLACLALGVAAISGVGSLSRSLADGLARQGRVILGGDVSFDFVQRAASPAELGLFQSLGRVETVDLLRAMARAPDGTTGLVELKAVPDGYPHLGQAELDPPGPIADALAEREGRFGIVAEPSLLARLGVKPGDQVHIGQATYVLRARLLHEPDRLAAGIGLGPRVILSEAALAQSGLVQPGSLVRRLYRVTLPDAAPNQPPGRAAIDRAIASAKDRFPAAGWDIRTRENVSPEFSRNLERFTQFLTLVGLTALLIGGIGVANAVRGFVARKRPVIATLKSLGATSPRIFQLMLLEVMVIAALGIAIGLAAGAALPFAVAALFAPVLPFPLAPSIYPGQLAMGLLYGALTALVFSVGPLGRAHDVGVSALFRDEVAPAAADLRWSYRLLMGAAGLLLAGAILAFSASRTLALIYLVATLAGFVVLRGVALGVMSLARRAPHSRSVAARLALANIHRPGALTPSVVLSLGLGLALLVTLTLIDGNIRAQLKQATPGETPSFFFLDVQSADARAFESFLAAKAPGARLELVPMMRGRIVAINDTPAEKVRASEKAAWVLQGDRGITFAADKPDGSDLVKGAWWPRDYAGPPLVSMEEGAARGLGLDVGDRLTVNVFGRDVTARIASLRKVDWRKFGINFVMVFSPNTFAGAPYGDLATITFPTSDDRRELSLLRDVARAYPGVTSIRVKDALDAVSGVLAQLATAIRGAAAVALLASMLVLAGALAAGQEARLYDAVVLKTLGATRLRLLAAFCLEYGLIGAATALFGLLAGLAAAYGIVTRVMSFDFVMLWPQALAAALGALIVTIALGLAGTWRILGRKPAAYLRTL